jgi:hypothetical protein
MPVGSRPIRLIAAALHGFVKVQGSDGERWEKKTLVSKK